MRRYSCRMFQSPGDEIMLSAAFRDLHLAYPGQFQTDVRTSSGKAVWENNPYITRLNEGEPGVEVIDMHYPLIHQSNSLPYHFIHGFVQFLEERLKVRIPITQFRGDIHLSQFERTTRPLNGLPLPVRFWIMIAGGKYDFTAKWGNPKTFQRVVDHFRDRITFVQCGEAGHWHPPLTGVVNLVGKTSTREFIHLMHWSDGVVCPVTFAMHLAAAVETRPGQPKHRPCVVIAGGREPSHWEAYTHHQYIGTNGMLSCCEEGGCWKSRCQLVGDGDAKDRHDLCEQPVQITPDLRIPRCMEMITADDVIRRIEMYLEGGAAKLCEGLQTSHCKPTEGLHALNLPVAKTEEACEIGRPSHSEHNEPMHDLVGKPADNLRHNGNRTVNNRDAMNTHTNATAGLQPPNRGVVMPTNTIQQPLPTANGVHNPGVQTEAKNILLTFQHGLGDAVQFTAVLRHLKHYKPNWNVDIRTLIGKHSAFEGLCRTVYLIDRDGPKGGYYLRQNLDWHENHTSDGRWPQTKVTRCLLDVFQMTPIPELCRYEIHPSDDAKQRARRYLEAVSGPPSDDGKFPVVLIHYEGNTSSERKNLSHELIREVCEIVLRKNHVPVILDWDRRSPLPDGIRIHNPRADHELWQRSGTGDAGTLAALIEMSTLMVGVDSGPLHVAGATKTPTIGVWTQHHPLRFYDLADNVLHLVPSNHASMIAAPGLTYFQQNYRFQTYQSLEAELPALIDDRLPGHPVKVQAVNHPLRSKSYTHEYYEEHREAGLDYLNFGDWQQQYGRWIVESLGYRGRRMLDVGCACGSVFRGLHQAGAVVQGVDLCESMIQLGRLTWPDMAAQLWVCDAVNLHLFADGSWDGLHSAQVAEHWKPELVPMILRELARVTATGGLFFCALDTEEMFARQNRHLETEDPTHVCIKPMSWWHQQLANNGWEVCTSEYEPVLRQHREDFLKRYDWDWWVVRRSTPVVRDKPMKL